MVFWMVCFIWGVHTMSNCEMKCYATACSASFVHRLNQSIVQPEKSAWNLSTRCRNFSATGEKVSHTCMFLSTHDM